MGNLTLCICTMNRPDELRLALESVFAGVVAPHQVIVSDDGDGSAEPVARDFDVLYQVGPGRGLGPNRNACLRVSTGDGVAFIDDDVTVPPDFVERASAIAGTHDVVTGWELNHSNEPPEKVTPHSPGFLGFQDRDPLGAYRSIVINATVFPASLFATAQFDEQIKYGYEEIDMARQATSQGYAIRYDDCLWVKHFPSAVNRESYSAALEASRLYLTFKAYARYERRPVKAILFAAVAGAHHLAHAAKVARPREAITTFRTARSYWQADRRVSID